MKRDSSSSTVWRAAWRRRVASRKPLERVHDGPDTGHDRHALPGRPGHELLGDGQRLVDPLGHLAEHAIDPLDLAGRQRRGTRRLADIAVRFANRGLISSSSCLAI